ncbi:hypothetical protein K450DRAFT_238844 [Umbelopsis ramanniana AG]|uniref:Uncharacterized protein n=1 Tax=Umbelopsis ramanniana AG TaxID=1314678 RepID=A0AAD5EB41_UMBRA|nr:uncharacterized protein K450DRAFT_238844 [Umbelopsis ramanniana AG]KAI8579994.1 hypothetical protein K450DRAFT_238844 [Umbelopsis ramanniana AG]
MLISSGECLTLSSIRLLPWIADLSVWCKSYSKVYAICFYDKNTQLGYNELLDVDCKEILHFMLAFNK